MYSANMAMTGVLDMIMQGVVTGPLVKRIGDRRTMIIGLIGGTVGLALMGWAPSGLMFILAMFPNALWGLAMPTIQSLMTRRVGEDEQGQLQGANSSVGSIAGVASPLFFGWIYWLSAGQGAAIPLPGLPFYLAAAVLLLAALIGWLVFRRERASEGHEAATPAP